MKRYLLALMLFSVIALTNSAQATIIEVFNINGTGTFANDYSQYQLGYNLDNPSPLGTFHFNEFVKIQPDRAAYTTFIDMIQRTFVPPADNDPFLSESAFNYANNELQMWDRFDDGKINRHLISPIPDLSAYVINALYVDNFTVQNGAAFDYATRLLADVSPAPVPEPSTCMLLTIAVAGIISLKMKLKGKTVHPLAGKVS